MTVEELEAALRKKNIRHAIDFENCIVECDDLAARLLPLIQPQRKPISESELQTALQLWGGEHLYALTDPKVAGSLAAYLLPLIQPDEILCYAPCEQHWGMPYKVELKYLLQPVKTICPICNPPAPETK